MLRVPCEKDKGSHLEVWILGVIREVWLNHNIEIFSKYFMTWIIISTCCCDTKRASACGQGVRWEVQRVWEWGTGRDQEQEHVSHRSFKANTRRDEYHEEPQEAVPWGASSKHWRWGESQYRQLIADQRQVRWNPPQPCGWRVSLGNSKTKLAGTTAEQEVYTKNKSTWKPNQPTCPSDVWFGEWWLII